MMLGHATACSTGQPCERTDDCPNSLYTLIKLMQTLLVTRYSTGSPVPWYGYIYMLTEHEIKSRLQTPDWSHRSGRQHAADVPAARSDAIRGTTSSPPTSGWRAAVEHEQRVVNTNEAEQHLVPSTAGVAGSKDGRGNTSQPAPP